MEIVTVFFSPQTFPPISYWVQWDDFMSSLYGWKNPTETTASSQTFPFMHSEYAAYTNWCPVTTRTGSTRYATNKLDENYGKFGWRARNIQPPRQRFAYSAKIKWNYLIKFSKLEMVGTCISIRRPRIIYTVGSSPVEELKRRWGKALHGARQNDR